MATVEMEQTQCSLLVSEYYKVLPEDTDAKGNVADLTGERDRNPESPEIFPTGCTRTYVGKFVIFNRPLCLMVSTESSLDLRLIVSCFLNVGTLWQVV